MLFNRFSPADSGDYYTESGELIGHEAAQVMAWATEHPDYLGSIEYERWDFEGSLSVRGFFYPDAEEADEALELARVA